jgi:hypothetical protein
MTKPYCSECNQDREIATLRALLAAQEARAQRVEQERDAAVNELRRLEWFDDHGEYGACCPSCAHWQDFGHAPDCPLRAALSQPADERGLSEIVRSSSDKPADERGHDYENDGNGVCVHCGYKVVPAQPAATGEGAPYFDTLEIAQPETHTVQGADGVVRKWYPGTDAPPGQSPTTLGREQGKP